MGRKKRLPVYEEVSIVDIGAEGKSIAKIDGQVVFVTKALPGDVVDIKITRRKKSYMEGLPLRFHKYSENRVKPFCKHFDLCGGCKWQDLPYAEQLKYKQQQVIDNLERIAKLELPSVNDILLSPETTYYRNKMEFTFSSFRWLREEELHISDENKEFRGLGLHIPGRWDKIVDIEHCYLQKEPSNKIRLAVKDFAIKNGYSFFNLRTHEGFLRNLIIRTSTTNEVMVVLVFAFEDAPARQNILNHLKEAFPELTALFYMINTKANDSVFDLEPVLYYGRAYIFEEMGELKFMVGPKSFYQTNSRQAYTLYKLVRQYAGLKGDEMVYDFYTGTGTIANFLAPHCKKVLGIDSVPEAIEDARQNAELNRLQNTTFISGDMKDLVKEDLFKTYGYPDVLITDPPRAGMHKDVVANILRASPERIVYVSCNPSTQARDIDMLSDQYRVVEVQPVDMFPHTYHVENVAVLDKHAS